MSKEDIIAGDILPLKEKMELFRSDTADLCVGAQVPSSSFWGMWEEGDAKRQPMDLIVLGRVFPCVWFCSLVRLCNTDNRNVVL